MDNEYFNFVDDYGNEFEIEVKEVFLNAEGKFIEPVYWRAEQEKEFKSQQESKLQRRLDEYNGQKWYDYNTLSREEFWEKYGEED